MIRITQTLALDETEIEERFVLASGPGGQHVNKAATAVQLRFDVAGSPSLPERVKARLADLAGRRMTAEGVLILVARGERSQDANRRVARARLIDLLRAAAAPPPPPRKATRPTAGARRRRLEGKTQRAGIKRQRQAPRLDD